MARPKKASANLTPEKDLRSLLKAAKSTESQTSELASDLRERIADAVTNTNLHRKAFSNARALDKLEPEELNAFFTHFDHYCEVFGLRVRGDSAPAFEMQKPGSESDSDNVSQINRGLRSRLADVG